MTFQMTEEIVKKVDPWAGVKDFAAGAFGGLGLVTAGHPFDTLKVLIQTGQAKTLGESVKICLKKGPMGFYAGALSPLIGLAAMNSVLFFGYMKTVRRFNKEGNVSKLTIPQVVLAGGVGGFLCSFVEGPQDLLKSKVQTGMGKNTVACAKEIVNTVGVRGLFQGIAATWIRNIPANMAYMGVYEYNKRLWGKGDSNKASKMQILMSGGVAGIFYWVTTYPFDTIKSVFQTQHSDPAKRKYKNWNQTAKGIYAEAGMAGFFKGFLPCMMRSFPANACCFFAYEVVKGFLDKM